MREKRKQLNTETFVKNPSVAAKMKKVILSVALSKELSCDWRACAARYEKTSLGAVQKFCKELQTFPDAALDRAIHSLLLEY